MAKKGCQPKKKVRTKRRKKTLLIIGLIFTCVILLIFSSYIMLKSFGKNSLQKHGGSIVNEQLSEQLGDTVKESDAEVQNQELKQGQILIDGEIYQYNSDILTFLCMGIDSKNGISNKKTPGKAGQADALLLVVVNPHKEKIQVIAINRDIMTDIERYDTAGIYVGTEIGQITLQYAYGDGREKSCELMEQRISELFYGIPIHGYGALDMTSIATLNDAVGGVEVTILEDMTKFKWNWTKGSKVLLSGSDALLYLRRRDTSTVGSNFGRIERQKQYLKLYVQKLKEKTKKDITFPLTLYHNLQKHIVTSLTANEIAYLADTLLGYDFSIENIISIPGESIMGKKYEEFYVDDTALKQIVIDIFYEKL